MNSLIRKYILGFTAAAFTAAVFFSTVGLPETVRISAEKELLSGNETKEESAVISEKSESAEDLKETAQKETDQKKDDQKQDSEEKDSEEKDDQKEEPETLADHVKGLRDFSAIEGMNPDVMVTHASEVDRNVLSAFLSCTCKRTCAVQLIAVERNNLPAEHGDSNQYSQKA